MSAFQDPYAALSAIRPRLADIMFVHRITCILVSRFLLNLRDTANDRTHGDIDMSSLGDPSFVAQSRGRDRGTTTSLRFAEFVDPMGAALDHGVGGPTYGSSTESSMTFDGGAGWDDDDERRVGMGISPREIQEDGNELNALRTVGEDAKEREKAEEGGNLVESPVSSNETSDEGISRRFEIEHLVRPFSDTRGSPQLIRYRCLLACCVIGVNYKSLIAADNTVRLYDY